MTAKDQLFTRAPEIWAKVAKHPSLVLAVGYNLAAMVACAAAGLVLRGYPDLGADGVEALSKIFAVLMTPGVIALFLVMLLQERDRSRRSR
ncbi:MAG: hypothetical protein WA988_08330 [Candidatus Nanopelagicales bacterium]